MDEPPKVPPIPADVADALLVHAAEIERLRGLIKSAVRVSGWDHKPEGDCPLCLELIVPDREESRHEEGCPWQTIVAEAAKP